MKIGAKQGGLCAALVLGLLGCACDAASGAINDDARYDDPKFCGTVLGDAKSAVAADAHRRCIIALGNAYLDAEQGSMDSASVPAAETVSRHLLGTDADFRPGNRDRLDAVLKQSILGAIKNRHWSVDGDVAWVIYDGELRTNPKPTSFPLGERLTIENGLIKEIILLAPSGIQ